MSPTLDERVAFLEGTVGQHSQMLEDLHKSIDRVDGHVLALDQKVDRFRDELGSRIEAVDQKIDRHVLALNQKIDGHYLALDQKIDGFRDGLGFRMERMENKFSRQFTWIVGLQVALLLTVIGALIQG